MSLPRWVVFLVAFWVLAWGGYRIYLAITLRPGGDDRPNFRKKGLFAMSRRRHALFGLLFLLLGGYLVAMGFGYYFVIGGPSEPAPEAEEAPAGGVNVDVE